MAITINSESKNSLSITNESKPTSGTFGSTPGRTFADGGTFGQPDTSLTREVKNTITLANEDKL